MMILKHYQEKSILAAYLLAASLLLFTLCFACRQWYHDWQLASHPLSAPLSAPAAAPADNVNALAAEHLFGQSLSKMMQAPLSNLQFRVTGIAKTNAEQANLSSKAYISIAGQPSKIVQIGDHLPYGATVYAIAADAVILENDGHLEKIPLVREKLQFKHRDEGDKA